ncbi:MAG: glycosyltransferase [Anaerolineae bacterium]
MSTKASYTSSARILVVTNLLSSTTFDRAVVGRLGGHSIYWYSLPCHPLATVDGYDGPPAFRSRLLQHLVSPLYLQRALFRFKPDLIHVHWALQRLLTPQLTHFHPLIVTEMAGEILPEQVYRGVNRIFVNQLLAAADIITSQSNFIDEALRQIGFYGSKVRRITWGIDLDRFRPGLEVSQLRRQWNLQNDDFIFFSVRNCRPLYNIHLIVQAFAECLSRTNHKIKLLISEVRANPAYHQQIKTMVQQLKLHEHVRFVGAIPHQDMPFYFNLANVTISLPYSDGTPHSLYESMACGSFHILGDLPSYYELIQHEHNGCLVPLNNPTALADAMIWCLNHPNHLAKAAQLGREQVLQIADKNIEIQRMNDIYAELLNQFR